MGSTEDCDPQCVVVETRDSMIDTDRNVENSGPLIRAVLEYAQTMQRLVSESDRLPDWAPLAEFVAVDGFERVGTFLEVQSWQQYTEMLTQWATAIDSFETTVRRVSELDGLVYFEIEERQDLPSRRLLAAARGPLNAATGSRPSCWVAPESPDRRRVR